MLVFQVLCWKKHWISAAKTWLRGNICYTRGEAEALADVDENKVQAAFS